MLLQQLLLALQRGHAAGRSGRFAPRLVQGGAALGARALECHLVPLLVVGEPAMRLGTNLLESSRMPVRDRRACPSLERHEQKARVPLSSGYLFPAPGEAGSPSLLCHVVGRRPWPRDHRRDALQQKGPYPGRLLCHVVARRWTPRERRRDGLQQVAGDAGGGRLPLELMTDVEMHGVLAAWTRRSLRARPGQASPSWHRGVDVCGGGPGPQRHEEDRRRIRGMDHRLEARG
mmetsp:Transcript_8174/g.20533  ORF Transcript_8174/g.20533 Transcript_8174/m.20533 type:complete len:232 (-) Transcript_8174:1370-2065(-)